MPSLKRIYHLCTEQQREDLRNAVIAGDRGLVYEILGIGSVEKVELIDAAKEDDWKNLRSLLELPNNIQGRDLMRLSPVDHFILITDEVYSP